MDNTPSLPKLLAALALGARSVNNLPLGTTSTSRNAPDATDGKDDEDYTEDEFSFRMSLPEFSSLNYEARSSLTALLCQALDGIEGTSAATDGGDTMIEEFEFEDPELWERCAEACDALLERVMAHVSGEERKKGGKGGLDANAVAGAIENASETARGKAAGAFGRMMNSIVDMEKPQNVYQGFVTHPPQNSRTEPFTPILFDPHKQALLDAGEFTRDGHGLDSRYGGSTTDDTNNASGDNGAFRKKNPQDIVAPSYHYDHPYRDEIESLEYRPWQLDVGEIADNQTTTKLSNDDLGIWISTEEDLSTLASRIVQGEKEGDIREIALDLEAHSHRTFNGFVCLIQLSLRRSASSNSTSSKSEKGGEESIMSGFDFLIDALALRHVIAKYLGDILANPNIVKVMHGADSDIPWLQRDFGCYIVNLFDTGRASRALKFPSAGLAYLLRKYAGIDPDKTHQLSDWRRRPLPEDMRIYAVSDTRYLLDIYDQLRIELEKNPLNDVSVQSVLDRSKRVCLIRYDKEPFRPMGYQTIMDGGNSRRRGSSKVTSDLSFQQEETLKGLYDWRDKTARQEDESVHYVCSNAALLRISSNRPATVSVLQRLINPVPPLVMRRSQEILDAIQKVSAKTTSADKSKGSIDIVASKTAPATGKKNISSLSRNREMLSPILGSEALYQQAGWMTPQPSAGETAFPTAEGTCSDSENEKSAPRVLDVDSANQGFVSLEKSAHSLTMSPPSLEDDTNAVEGVTKINNRKGRGSSAKGHGTSCAALGSSDGSNSKKAEEETKTAQRSAEFIRKEMVKSVSDSGKTGKAGGGFSLIDFIRPVAISEDFGFEDSNPDGNNSDNDPAHNSPMNNKSSSTAAGEDAGLSLPKSMREIYNLSNANRRRANKEKTSGKTLLFEEDDDDILGMKEDDIRGAEAVLASRGGATGYFGNSKRQRVGAAAPGKEGDIELMVKMGWVKDKEDAESLIGPPAASAECGDEKDRDSSVSQKNSNTNSNRSQENNRSRGSGKDKGFDYSSVGAVGAFGQNAAPSNNPFFGAASGAASMFAESRNSKQSNQKRNKKR